MTVNGICFAKWRFYYLPVRIYFQRMNDLLLLKWKDLEMAKNNNQNLPLDTKIEVVMRKEVTLRLYYEMYDEAKKKGWHIQAFQKGFLKPINDVT